MRRGVLFLLAAVVGCGSGQSARYPGDAERAAYERAAAAGTPAAYRNYLRSYAGRDPGRTADVRRRYEGLREAGIAAIEREGSLEACRRHEDRFPEDRERVAAARRVGLRNAVSRARTAHLEVDYREAGEVAPLPDGVRERIEAVLAFAGISLVPSPDAPITLRLQGNARVQSASYSDGSKMSDAYARFDGRLQLRHESGYRTHEGLEGVVSRAPMHVVWMDDPDKRVRRGSAKPSEGIGRVRIERAVLRILLDSHGPAPVVRALREADGPLEYEVLEILQYGPPVPGQVAALRALLRDADARIQRRAVRALERYWRPGPDAPLADRLAFCFFADFRFGEPVNRTGFPDSTLARATAELRGIGDAPERAAMLLGVLGEPGLDVLVERLSSERPPEAVLWALAKAGPPAERVLLRVLREGDGPARKNAERALAMMGSAAALPVVGPDAREQIEGKTIETRLAGDDHAARLAAAKRLLGTADPRFFEPLLERLEDSDRVRYHATRALGLLGDSRALPALRERARFPGAGDPARVAIGRILAYGPPVR